MANRTTDGRPTMDGWNPQKIDEGYKPTSPQTPPNTGREQGGYQPTSQGDNPSNNPTPPGAE